MHGRYSLYLSVKASFLKLSNHVKLPRNAINLAPWLELAGAHVSAWKETRGSFYNEASSLPGPPHCFFGCFVVVVAAEQRQSSHRVCSSAHNPQKLSIIHKKCMWGCNLEPKSSVPIEMNEKASIPSFCRMVCNENILFRHGARTLCDTFEPCDGHKAF